MDALLINRRTIKSMITRTQTAYDNNGATPLTLQEIVIHIEKLDALVTRAYDLQNEITALCQDDVEIGKHETEFADIEGRIIKLSSQLNVLKETLRPTNPGRPIVSTTRSSPDTNVRLPRLELPTFSGNFSEWLPFHDLFSATIDQNATLSGAQKLQYLKSSLKDEASNLIASLQVTDNNYAEAWKLLKERYDNKREIVLSQLDRLFSQPGTKNESSVEIRKLIDTTTEVLRSLTVLGQSVDKWDIIIVHFIARKLDSETRRQWELSLLSDALPTWKEFYAFLDRRARALSAAGSTDIHQPTRQVTVNKRNIAASTHHGTTGLSCPICENNHFVNRCPDFLSATPYEKKEMIIRNKLCYNCLKSGHFTAKCQSGACRTCGGHHHTLLHMETRSSQVSTAPPKKKDNVPQQQSTSIVSNPDATPENAGLLSSHYSCHDDRTTRVLLQTALVNVLDSRGSSQVCRALLDSGSQASFISEDCVQRLGLQRKRTHVQLNGISASEQGSAQSFVSLRLFSCYDSRKVFNVEALVLKKVTSILPQVPLDASKWTHLTGLKLADPSFNTPGKIELLIGADLCSELLLEGKITGRKGSPIANESHLGWVLSGKLVTAAVCSSVDNYHVNCDLDSMLRRFWELEELPEQEHLTNEEKQCENHFMENYTRLENGRFSVKLPFKENKIGLGESRQIAIRRLMAMERKLSNKQEYLDQYRQFMKEYEELGHMELINTSEIHKKSSEVCYLPHHFVLKESSTTTKFRTVFDASAKTASGISLNDTLMVGGKLQDDIVPLLLRFRKHAVAMTADIAKMYRQILVHPEERDYQRIVWRDTPDMPIKDYKLCTITYGTASAPFLAVRAVQQLAKLEGDAYPLAAKIILSDFFVDDMISGHDKIEDALELQRQLLSLLAKGGFNLRKWSSNHPSLLESITEDMRETALPMTFASDASVKALGIHWQPATDEFGYKLALSPTTKDVSEVDSLTSRECGLVTGSSEVFTKRLLLSEIAKLYDPLGWLSPVTIKAKILMQQAWKEGLQWDEPLPSSIQSIWTAFRADLFAVEQIRIPRYVMQSNMKRVELHGFSDASEQAYAGVVFIRTISHQDDVKVVMLTAKAKVAPVRQVSLPRLELCGAVLVSTLLRKVRDALQINIDDFYLWTDSTVVLAWLQSHPSRWATFVANRVAIIQECFPVHCWNHVAGEYNPADCASRGITASSLVNFQLWWNGPVFLRQVKLTIPIKSSVYKTSEEEKKVKIVHHVAYDLDLVDTFSSLSKLQRVTAYCLRFIRNLSFKKEERQSGHLTTSELEDALKILIVRAQKHEFSEDILRLKKSVPLSPRSRIATLNPFIDDYGLLRVGGRIREAVINPDKKFPILLPPGHRLTEMIIQHYHLRYLHAGPQLLLASLQQKYWVLRGRDVVRRLVKKCLRCFRHSAEFTNQQMGNLPSPRVNPVRPFLKCGVDYAGPINLKIMKGRNCKTFKGYIAVFICLATKAIHLELVSDLSTDAYIAAFRRFISRRGICSDIYSDNGTNFVGAANELKELRRLFISQKWIKDISKELLHEGVTTHFLPPLSPNMAGIWEAGVKSVKYHLRRILNDTTLNFEEMTTLLAQIEACLNSRPLTALSSDPDDLSPLTPGHFLIGAPMKALPEPDFSHVKMNHLSRWQYIQRLMQHFWKRWSTEYLSRLQQRPKWWSKKDNLKIGDLVLIKDEHLPPSIWKLGRVFDTHPGKDNLVRVATVRVLDNSSGKDSFKYKTYVRPICKLAPLPFDVQ